VAPRRFGDGLAASVRTRIAGRRPKMRRRQGERACSRRARPRVIGMARPCPPRWVAELLMWDPGTLLEGRQRTSDSRAMCPCSATDDVLPRFGNPPIPRPFDQVERLSGYRAPKSLANFGEIESFPAEAHHQALSSERQTHTQDRPLTVADRRCARYRARRRHLLNPPPPLYASPDGAHVVVSVPGCTTGWEPMRRPFRGRRRDRRRRATGRSRAPVPRSLLRPRCLLRSRATGRRSRPVNR
jgi:hypothetical protein